MMNIESPRGKILPILLVLISAPALGVAHLFGLLPVVGIVLFLAAAVITIFFKKIYHIFVLTGICLLFCVFIEPSPSDAIFCVAIPLGLLIGTYKPRLRGTSLYIVLLFAGYFLACLPGIALAEDTSGAIRYYAITLYLFGLAFFIATYSRKDNIKTLLRAYILAAFLSFIAGLAGYLGFYSNILMMDSFRVRGLFKDPNVFGPFFVPAILLVIDDIKKRTLIKARPFVHLFLIVTMTLGAIFSFSRGAWINLFITVVAYYFLKGELLKLLKPKRLIPILIVFVALIVVFTLPFMESTGIKDFLTQRAQLQDYDSNRFNAQEGGLKMVIENPLGCGPGQFESNIAAITKYQLSAHSLYVRLAAENGIAGFLFFFTALACLIVSLWQRRRGLKKVLQQPTALKEAEMNRGEALTERDELTSKDTEAIISEEVQHMDILTVAISVLCGLLVSSIAVDTIHWRSFWFFLGIGMYVLNEKWSDKSTD